MMKLVAGWSVASGPGVKALILAYDVTDKNARFAWMDRNGKRGAKTHEGGKGNGIPAPYD